MIVKGARDITAGHNLRLCKFFGLSEGYFLRLQNAYDTMEAKRKIAAKVAKIRPYRIPGGDHAEFITPASAHFFRPFD